jgi:YidC/Oxa1 family membrane protein insertase
MEKRVVIFLILSLAVIFGYDLLLKQLGLLPPPPDTVEGPPAKTMGTPSSGSDVPPSEHGRDLLDSLVFR